MTELQPADRGPVQSGSVGLLRPGRAVHQLHAQALAGALAHAENDFTNRNTTFATWNMLHLARMIKDAGGIPAHGNQRTAWDAGCRFDFVNPAYR